MGNLCCRRAVGYSPNGNELEHNRCQQQQQQTQQPSSKTAMSHAYHNSGDDCAINELLEGRMDLDVILPDGRKVRLTVERRTPMMDLLVQAASATKISPGGHMIHVFGEGGKGHNTLHYKPSTPIGSLDTNTICIVPKKDVQETTLKRFQRIANRPFEPTFRVQVHLPRNQLSVIRVSPRVKMCELRNMVCQEKGLDTSRYQMVRPSDPTQPLSGEMSLAEYGSTEITLLSNSSIESNMCHSTSHIMLYSKRAEDQQKRKTTGILRLIAEDANKKTEKNKAAANGKSRLVPTIKVDDHQLRQGRYKPKKRRPAPPPPPPAVLPEAPPFHSRQSSSDSSGYHEATSSLLHEDEKASSDSSGVSSLEATKVATVVEPPPVLNLKKRKAPPPPPQEGSAATLLKEESPPMQEIRPPDPVLTDEDVNHLSESKTLQKSEGAAEKIQPKQSTPAQISSPANDVEKRVQEEEDKTSTLEKRIELVAEDFHPVEPVAPLPSMTPQEPPCLNVRVKSSVQEKEPKQHKQSNLEKNEPVTRVALVALNAKIEQDVTQQEIASSIQAAFHSLEAPQRLGPSLLSIKQRVCRPDTCQDDRQSESAKDVLLPQKQSSAVPDSNDAHCNLYPLQKSSATLTLNLETKDDIAGLEAFPPPPSEFRGDEKEALLIDQEPPRSRAGSQSLKRSSSLLSVADAASPKQPTLKSKNRNLQRSLSDVSVDDDDGEFELEQERLQLEYLKLQRQFIQWQQQLLSNHAMLSEECILPPYARTLRQSHSLPEGEDYSEEAQSPVPLVSRSLSYEPTRSTTLPRSTINIPSLELNSKPITNGSSTLRSSKNKNYFKPPQIRVSTKSRQRLPPEIRKDGELDITDDHKILSTILPTFDSLKLITEHREEDVTPKKSHLQNNGLSLKLENDYNRKVQEKPQNPNKLATFPKPQFTKNNSKATQNGHSEVNGKYVNGDNGPLTRLQTCQKTVELTVCHPPAPPLPPQNGKSKEMLAVHSNIASKETNKVIKKEFQPCVDPREQLMTEIRKFGGRTALRKISLA